MGLHHFTPQQIKHSICHDVGHCFKCGAAHHGIEEDQKRMYCTDCKTPTVYGGSELSRIQYNASRKSRN